jgi:hypothetical protein
MSSALIPCIFPSVARHSSEKYAGTKVFYGIGLLLNMLGLDFDLARLITTYLMELPNSRKQEMEGGCSHPSLTDVLRLTYREADEIGLRLLSKACYDPRAMPA